MMVRTQISLPPEEHRRAKQRAADLGISLAQYIRRVVSDDLGARGPHADITELFGIAHSGGSDVARHKDDYVGEAVAAGHRRAP